MKRSEHEELIVAHRARMGTEDAKAVYRLRKQTVELGYADLKENRKLRGFSGRGLARARIEAGLNELARNLLIVERGLVVRRTDRYNATFAVRLPTQTGTRGGS